MPTLADLSQGTSEVLPSILGRYLDGTFSVLSMNITNMLGVKTKLITARTSSASRHQLHHNVRIHFLGLEDPAEAIPSSIETRCQVRCTCEAYYFYAIYANDIAQAQAGGPYTKYVRKTPINDPRYPPKNPRNIPMMCKHLMLLMAWLEFRGMIK